VRKVGLHVGAQSDTVNSLLIHTPRDRPRAMGYKGVWDSVELKSWSRVISHMSPRHFCRASDDCPLGVPLLPGREELEIYSDPP
jgi:hypothetical protein